MSKGNYQRRVKFWRLQKEGTSHSHWVHYTLPEAIAEAMRLAAIEQKKMFIMEAMGYVSKEGQLIELTKLKSELSAPKPRVKKGVANATK